MTYLSKSHALKKSKVVRKKRGMPCLLLWFASSTLCAISLESEVCCDLWDPWWTDRKMWERDSIKPDYKKRLERHHQFMHSNIASEYQGQKNPLSPTDNVIHNGAELYNLHCAECHGKNGMGDGALARGLSPSPALLAYMIGMPMVVDEYMLWSISEGGEQFATEMPAFKKILQRKEIWEVIIFMRAGFPKLHSKELYK